MSDQDYIEFRERKLYGLLSGELVRLMGTPDLVRVWPKKGVAAITDYKFIRKPITDADANLQLRAYVVLVDEAFGIGNLQHIYACLVCPRLERKPHIVEYRPKDVAKARDELIRTWDKCHQENARRNASAIACAFCTASLICMEHKAWLGEVEKVRGLPVSQWTDEQMELFETRKSALEKFIEDAHKQIKAIKAANPNRLPDWNLKPGNEVRVVVDIVAAYRALIAAGICTDQQFSDASVLKLSDLERIVWAALHGSPNQKTQAQVKELVNQTLRDVIVLKQNEPSLERKKE